MLVIRIPLYDAHAASNYFCSCSTFCILMEFPTYIDTIKMGLSIVYCMGHRQIFSKLCCIFVPWLCLSLENIADPYECSVYAAFHLGLHCLPEYGFRWGRERERELVALLNLPSWCLVMVEWLLLAVPWGCLRFVIVVFPDHTHLG